MAYQYGQWRGLPFVKTVDGLIAGILESNFTAFAAILLRELELSALPMYLTLKCFLYNSFSRQGSYQPELQNNDARRQEELFWMAYVGGCS